MDNCFFSVMQACCRLLEAEEAAQPTLLMDGWMEGG